MFARDDVASAQVTLTAGDTPIQLEVTRAHLYFFDDVDIVIMALELRAADLPLPQVQDIAFRFGRAYPAEWEADGSGARCPAPVAWVSAAGTTLAKSDYGDRARYLSCVGRHRAPAIVTHWEWLLRPMLPEHAPGPDPLRYRQLDYYRMPLMCYVAVDDLRVLDRADFIRFGLVTGPGDAGTLPYAAESLASFEADFCIDRYWAPHERHTWSDARFVCTGHSFLIAARHGDAFAADPRTGLLGQFAASIFSSGCWPTSIRLRSCSCRTGWWKLSVGSTCATWSRSSSSSAGYGAFTRRFCGSPTATGFTKSRPKISGASCSALGPATSAPSGCTRKCARRSRT